MHKEHQNSCTIQEVSQKHNQPRIYHEFTLHTTSTFNFPPRTRCLHDDFVDSRTVVELAREHHKGYNKAQQKVEGGLQQQTFFWTTRSSIESVEAHHTSLFDGNMLYLRIATLLLVITTAAGTSDDHKPHHIDNPAIVEANKTKIFTNINENYQSSSKSLDAVAKRLEEKRNERQLKMRKYWKQTFAEIKSSNPVVFPSEEEKMRNRKSGEKMLEAWKQFLDSGGSTPLFLEEEDGILGSSGSNNRTLFKPVLSNMTQLVAPRRFDGVQTWEKQLQQWSEEVSTYLAETESTLNELLQPRESSGYDMSSFGVSSDALGNLTRSAENGFSNRHEMKQHKDGKTKSSPFSERLGIDKSVTPIPPITLANLDPNLPPIPKPRPVTPEDEILPHTNIADKSKNIWIVTTASLPWMTGTAVNPLLRAAYLSTGRKAAGGSITLMLPWVERDEDQKRIYGKEKMFESPQDQEQFVRTWLRDTANMKEASEDLKIQWYTAWQEVLENSLYSMGDLIGLIPEDECDICVLEEPEHLNWYRGPGDNWTSKFKHVVGIVHTNYFVYATEQPAAFIRAPGMKLLASWMCRAHVHRLIKLSGTLGQFAPEKELVENVHGVRRSFIDVGEELRGKLTAPDAEKDPVFSADASPAVYFIGKMLWSKGLASLMELIKYAEESAGLKVKVDMYGGGPDKDEASEKAESMSLDMPFHGPIDHVELGWTHKVFINPSTSEVLCTTVAEALAMGKFVVLPSHPSNDFFCQFPNCLPYSNKEEFVGNLYYALTHSPEPMSEEYSYALSWEAATERFAAAGSVSVAEAEAMEEALSSADAGIDIILPSIKINKERKEIISRSFRNTRGRYRNFRTRLSQEIMKSDVLPKELQQRLIAELDKRLDVDLDELLDSPKLRVKLSPAKLDKLLLDLYDGVTKGPSGDVFRVIGGGASVGRQHLYLKQQAAKTVTHQQSKPPSFLDASVLNKSSPTTLVTNALNRNFPPNDKKIDDTSTTENNRKEENVPKMSLSCHRRRQVQSSSWGVRLVRHGSFTQSRPSQTRYVPLI